MPELIIPFELTANTPARASEVMANFTAVASVVNGSIEAVNLADNSVTAGKIADGAVTEDKLAAGAALANLGEGGVTSTYLANVSVTANKLATGAVTADKIASGAVTLNKVADGAIRPSKTTFLSHAQSDTFIAFARVSHTGDIIDTGSVPAGWTGSKLGTGLYRISNTGASATLAIVVTPQTTASEPAKLFASVRQVTSGQFDVGIFDLSGTYVDSIFSLMIMGRA